MFALPHLQHPVNIMASAEGISMVFSVLSRLSKSSGLWGLQEDVIIQGQDSKILLQQILIQQDTVILAM